MPFESAEKYAIPFEGKWGLSFARRNEFNEAFFLRWGRIRFEVAWGAEANLKVVVKVHRSGGVCEKFLVDTDAYDMEWNRHKRRHSRFFIHPFPPKGGRVEKVGFLLWRTSRAAQSYCAMSIYSWTAPRWTKTALGGGLSAASGWRPTIIAPAKRATPTEPRHT